MNEITYVMRLIKRGRKPGLMISEVRRIGQKYTEIMEGGYWAPRGVFEIRDLRWCSSLNTAKRFMRTLPPASEPTTILSMGELTFTGSGGGPGLWPFSTKNGPLFAIIAQ